MIGENKADDPGDELEVINVENALYWNLAGIQTLLICTLTRTINPNKIRILHSKISTIKRAISKTVHANTGIVTSSSKFFASYKSVMYTTPARITRTVMAMAMSFDTRYPQTPSCNMGAVRRNFWVRCLDTSRSFYTTDTSRRLCFGCVILENITNVIRSCLAFERLCHFASSPYIFLKNSNLM